MLTRNSPLLITSIRLSRFADISKRNYRGILVWPEKIISNNCLKYALTLQKCAGFLQNCTLIPPSSNSHGCFHKDSTLELSYLEKSGIR